MKHASGFASRLLLVCVVVILTAGLTSTAWGQLLFEDNFNYTSGTLLTANGWTAHSGGGTNAQLVTNYGLTYPGYASSGIGFADSVRNTGEDDNRTFTQVTSGTLYAGCLAQIDAATTGGDYFFHVAVAPVSTSFYDRVFVKNDGSGNLAFGISKNNGTVGYTGFVYSLHTTYLLVTKHTFIAGNTNDVAELFVNPVIGAPEPASTVVAGDNTAVGDPGNLGGVAVRQGGSTTGPTLALDGIRVGKTWGDVTGPLAAPTVVTGLASAVAATGVTLNGTVNPNNASTTVAFNYGLTNAYGSSVTANESPLAVGGSVQNVTGTVTGLVQNQLYHFQVSATNSQGGPIVGLDATFTTVPDAPVATAASSLLETGFTANWGSGAGNAPATYTLDVATDNGFTSMVAGYPQTGIATPSFAVTGLTGGSTYYYRVRGVDAGGSSLNSNTITVLTVPAAPVAIAASAIGASAFTANWNADAGVVDYRLDVATDNLFTSILAGYNDLTVNDTNQAVTGLTPSTNYYYRVRGVNASGTSVNSNIINVTTQGVSIPSLASPTATAIEPTTATLGATITSDNFSTITERGIVWSTSANPTTADNKLIEGGTAVGTYTVSATGLPSATEIHYRGYAINGVGTGYTSDATFFTLSTEPTSHAGSFAATATSTSTIDLSWTAATGANGYLIIQRSGSDPTGTPDDATGYSVGNAIGDGSVAALVTGTSTTISSLTSNTTWHFSIIPFNWDGANATTYNYYTAATIPTANATTFSTASDVIATPGFIYSTEIPYINFTGISDITDLNSVPAFGITVRDGGASADADANSTTLTAISFNVTNVGFISRAALYDGTTELAEVAVTSSPITFTALTAVALDGGTKDLVLRVVFGNTVNDQQQFSFTVASVTAASSGSGFAASDGGAAVSSTAGDDNRVEVSATKVIFAGPIANTLPATNFTASAKAVDANNNTDIGYSTAITFAKASGPGTLSGTTAPPVVNGVATSTDLQFDLGGMYTLSASSGVLTPGISSIFAVVSPAKFRVAAGADTMYWDNTSTWVIESGGSATGIPHGKDSVIFDLKYHHGGYVVSTGPDAAQSVSLNDSAMQITIGTMADIDSPKVKLLVPHNAPVPLGYNFLFGNATTGDYDMVIQGNGVVSDEKDNFNRSIAYKTLSDSMWIRTGGYWYHNTKGFNTMHRVLSRRFDGDYGTIEFDINGATSGGFDISGGGNYYYPNIIISNTHAFSTYYWFGSGATYIKGNLTINPGAKDSLMLTGYPFIHYGDIVNNGILMAPTYVTTSTPTSPIAFANSTRQQVVSGNPLILGDGMVCLNPFGVKFNSAVSVPGGVVQTGGNYTFDWTGTAVFVTVPAQGIIDLGANTMTLDPTGSLNEGPNAILGTITATRTAGTSDQAFGNIGFEIVSAAVAPGQTTVVRKNGTALSGNGHSSMKRYYDVTPTLNTGLGASVKVSYVLSELNGVTESGIKPYSPLLQKSPDLGTTWSGQANTVNSGLHQMLASNVQSLQYRWTGADVNAPLFITHTLALQKLSDLDGNPSTKLDQSGKQWWLSLYRDSVTAGTLIGTANPGLPRPGYFPSTNLEAGTYIAVEQDSLGWLHLGVNERGNSLGSGTLKVGAMTADTVVLTDAHPSSVDTIEFINQKVSILTAMKFRDLDGNLLTIENRKAWGLTMYSGSVAPANIVAQGNVDSLTAQGLQAGTYIITEADSGSAWVRINGNHKLADTIVISAGQVVIDTFINFKPNTVNLYKVSDADGNFGTIADRTPKVWHLELHQGSSTGPVVSQVNASFDTLPGLGDGTYTAVEGDSTGWIHLGYTVNGIPTGTTEDTVTVTVSDGQLKNVVFVNAPPIYSTKFRSFAQRKIAFDVDNKSKVNKPVVMKADKDQFDIKLTVDSANVTDLHIEFGAAIDTFMTLQTVPPSTHSTLDSKLKKWDFVLNAPLTTSDSIHILGYAWTNKPVKLSGYWWTRGGVEVGKTRKAYVLAKSTLRDPMPNRVNALAAMLNPKSQIGFGATGLIVGKNEKTPNDSSKYYGWLQLTKYGDLLKTIYTKGTGQPTSGAAHPFDLFTETGKVIKGKQTSMPIAKEKNSLMANMIALKLNIMASDLGIVPPGLGDLIYNAGGTDPFNQLTLRQLAALGDSVMMGWLKDSVDAHNKPIKLHKFNYAFDFNALDNVIAKIDTAFEGPMDTTSFAGTGGLAFTGTTMLINVPFLHADPNKIPARIVPVVLYPESEIPVAYKLYQNFPNPFNPTTTIQFDLPEASIVTLKIYNILGQEMATLLNHQQMDYGQQQVVFNASRYASGVYFYRLVTSQVTNPDDGSASGMATVNTMKMLLIK